jgi:hypothetical protein
MEGLHVVDDIFTKISINCVINLHVALLFTCLFLWVLSIYATCICLLLFQYETVYLHNVFVCLHFIYNVPKEFYVYMF